MRQYSAPSPTRYDPVIINSSASNAGDTTVNLKEYETQVLAMAVPPDGDDDLQLDFSAKNHAFSLDNVSYITHKEHNGGNGSVIGSSHNGQSSPAHSDATTATIATLRRNNNNLNNLSNHNNSNNLTMNNRQNTFNRNLEMNSRNNANPMAAAANGGGSLTLGRLKHNNSTAQNHYQNGGYKLDTVSRNNLANIQNNTYSNTLGRRGNNTFGTPTNNGYGMDNGELMTNTLGRNNNSNQGRTTYTEVPITNPLYQR